MISCSDSSNHERNDQNGNNILKGTLLSTLDLMCPYDVLMTQDYLVFLDGCSELKFQIYSKTELNLLYEFGMGGDGPSELDHPKFTGQKEYTENIIYYFDRNKLHFVDIDSLMSIGIDVIGEIEMPVRAGYVESALVADQGILVGSQHLESDGKAFISRDGATQFIPFSPKLEFPTNYLKDYIIYGSEVMLFKDFLVVVMDFFKRIELYDLDGNLISINVQEEPQLNSKINDANNIMPGVVRRYYNLIRVNGNEIHVLDYNMTMDQYQNDDIVNTRIDSFDEDLNLISSGQFDQFIISFDLDSKNIIGVSYGTENTEFGVYSFSR